jgi:hypothetical protein
MFHGSGPHLHMLEIWKTHSLLSIPTLAIPFPLWWGKRALACCSFGNQNLLQLVMVLQPFEVLNKEGVKKSNNKHQLWFWHETNSISGNVLVSILVAFAISSANLRHCFQCFRAALASAVTLHQQASTAS